MNAVMKTAAVPRPKLTIGGPKPAALAVIPSAPRPFPLRSLVRAPENVRRIRVDEDVSSLADDIRAHGLLQSLIGYDAGADGKVHIVGGGRRLQALDSLMFDGVIDGEFPVPVLIRDREHAVELSLAENLQQRTMSPVDEVFAFKALVDTGHHSPTDLAKRFGFSERVVKQRLRLADLAPEILDALAEKRITLDSAMAYASTQDRTVQLETFSAESKRSWNAHTPHSIRQMVDAKGMRDTHPIFRFVGAEIYEARGGAYEDDLFRGDPDGARVLANPALLLAIAAGLVDERMAERLPKLQADPALSPSLIGHIAVPGLKLASWGYSGPLPTPPGTVIVDQYDYEPMWRTIRNNSIDVRIVVGINDAGVLIHWPRMVAVDKGQRDAIARPAAPAGGYVPPTPEQLAEVARTRGIVRWSRRLAVNSLGGSPLFAGTPLEGRAYWPKGDGEPFTIDGVAGVLVSVDVFVTDAEIAAQRKAADARYAQERAEIEQQQAARRDAEAAKDRRLQELSDMLPEPAIIVLDGAAWQREDDGTYSSIADDAEPFSDWDQLLDVAASEGVEIGDTFTTREEWQAAIAAAEGGVE